MKKLKVRKIAQLYYESLEDEDTTKEESAALNELFVDQMDWEEIARKRGFRQGVAMTVVGLVGYSVLNNIF